eukprot:COSAG02_NODE_2495_length_8684_cov_12.735469_4_plen_70_part_00
MRTRNVGKRRTHVSDRNLSANKVCLDSLQGIFLSARAGRYACFHTERDIVACCRVIVPKGDETHAHRVL